MHSIFTYLFRFFLVIISIPIILTGTITSISLKSFLNQLIVKEMETDIQIVQEITEVYGALWTVKHLDPKKAGSFIDKFLSVTQTVRFYDQDYNVMAVYGKIRPENEEQLRKKFNVVLIPTATEWPEGPAYIEVFPSPVKLFGQQSLAKKIKSSVYKYLLILAFSLPLILWIAYSISKKFTRNISQLTNTLIELAEGGRNVDFSFTGYSTETKEIAKAAENLQNQLIKKETTMLHRLQELTHDLKGPIAGLYNQLESVELGAMELTQERFNHFYRELGYLNQLIEDMSVLYELEDDHEGVNFREIETQQELITPLIERYAPIADEKGIRLNSDVRIRRICANPVLLNRAIGNLIQNSIRYGRGQDIEIIVFKDDGTKENIIEVKNKGQIPEEDLPYLFTRYWRKGQGQRGSGLGLPISRLIARKHKGDLVVQNQEPDYVVSQFRFSPDICWKPPRANGLILPEYSRLQKQPL